MCDEEVDTYLGQAICGLRHRVARLGTTKGATGAKTAVIRTAIAKIIVNGVEAARGSRSVCLFISGDFGSGIRALHGSLRPVQ